MKRPIIKLKFNRKLDKGLTWNFYSRPEFGGCDFWKKRALKHHPRLIEIGSVKNKNKFLNEYIFGFYKSNDREIKNFAKNTIEYLNQEQDKFFLTQDV